MERELGVHNLVGKTENIVEAVSFVVGATFFIGFDGVFSFVAASQKVPTVNFSLLSPNPRYQEDTCSEWRKYTILIEGIPGATPIMLKDEQFLNIIGKLEVMRQRNERL